MTKQETPDAKPASTYSWMCQWCGDEAEHPYRTKCAKSPNEKHQWSSRGGGPAPADVQTCDRGTKGCDVAGFHAGSCRVSSERVPASAPVSSALPDVVAFRKLAMAYLGEQGVFSPRRCDSLIKLLKEVYDAGRVERLASASASPHTMMEDGRCGVPLRGPLPKDHGMAQRHEMTRTAEENK